MEAVTKITLDLLRPESAVVVYAKQNDSATRTIEATLLVGGVKYDIPEDCVATFSARKPNDKAIWNDAVIGESTLSYTLTQNDLKAAGLMIAEFVLYKSTVRIASFRFRVLVEESAVADQEIEDSDEFTALQQAIANLQAPFFAFDLEEDGDLFLYYTIPTNVPDFELDSNGDLYYNVQ